VPAEPLSWNNKMIKLVARHRTAAMQFAPMKLYTRSMCVCVRARKRERERKRRRQPLCVSFSHLHKSACLCFWELCAHLNEEQRAPCMRAYVYAFISLSTRQFRALLPGSLRWKIQKNRSILELTPDAWRKVVDGEKTEKENRSGLVQS